MTETRSIEGVLAELLLPWGTSKGLSTAPGCFSADLTRPGRLQSSKVNGISSRRSLVKAGYAVFNVPSTPPLHVLMSPIIE